MRSTLKNSRSKWEYTTYTCPTGKRAYPSRTAAKQAYKQHLSKREHMRPYRCEACNGWHLGHLDYPTMRGLR